MGFSICSARRWRGCRNTAASVHCGRRLPVLQPRRTEGGIHVRSRRDRHRTLDISAMAEAHRPDIGLPFARVQQRRPRRPDPLAEANMRRAKPQAPNRRAGRTPAHLKDTCTSICGTKRIGARNGRGAVAGSRHTPRSARSAAPGSPISSTAVAPTPIGWLPASAACPGRRSSSGRPSIRAWCGFCRATAITTARPMLSSGVYRRKAWRGSAGSRGRACGSCASPSATRRRPTTMSMTLSRQCVMRSPRRAPDRDLCEDRVSVVNQTAPRMNVQRTSITPPCSLSVKRPLDGLAPIENPWAGRLTCWSATSALLL
jgi:hypothetical protein